MNFCVPAERMQCYLGQVTRYSGLDALAHLFRMSDIDRPLRNRVFDAVFHWF